MWRCSVRGGGLRAEHPALERPWERWEKSQAILLVSRPQSLRQIRVADSLHVPHHARLCYILSGGTEMKTLSIREMRGALGRLDQLVDQEGELIITRRGQAIARVSPLKPQRVMPSHAEHRSRLPQLSPSAELVREDRDAR